MFFLDLVSNKRVQLAPSMGPGSSQVMPMDSSMTGLKGQERTEGQAGLMFPGPLGSWHPYSIQGAPGLSLPWLSCQHCFLPFGQALPQPFGLRKWEPGRAQGASIGSPSSRYRGLKDLSPASEGENKVTVVWRGWCCLRMRLMCPMLGGCSGRFMNDMWEPWMVRMERRHELR